MNVDSRKPIAMVVLLTLIAAVALVFNAGSGGVRQGDAATAGSPDLSITVNDPGNSILCTTKAGGPANCEIPVGGQLTVEAEIDALGANFPNGYSGHQVRLNYSGGLTLKNRPGTQEMDAWPDCGIPAELKQAGTYLGGCNTAPLAPMSTYTGAAYTGAAMEVDFTCGSTPSSETVVLDHGIPSDSQVFDETTIPFADKDPDETLTINCAAIPAQAKAIACPVVPNFVFPAAGCDNFRSRFVVEVEIIDPPATVLCNGTGPTQVTRTAIGDKQPNGLDEFNTEMTYLKLEASCTPGDFSVTVRESPTFASSGQVEEQVNNTPGTLEFPADSFFDIFFEIESPLGTMRNKDPLTLTCEVSSIPPTGCLYVPTVPSVDLFDDTQTVVAVLNHGEHEPGEDDTDFDGCSDSQEKGSDEALGGRRSQYNPWDFFDTPHPNLVPQRDGVISIGDIARVVARFGANDAGPGTFDRDSDPLSTPNKVTGDSREDYHPSYDRGGTIAGQNLWNLLPPDGAISVGDIAAAVAQFGHSCL